MPSIWPLALFPVALRASLHPLPADVFLENLRSDLSVPHSHVAHWDDLVDPATSQRGMLSPSAGLRRLLASNDLSPSKLWATFVSTDFPASYLPHRLRPSCSSLEGPVCKPLEDSPIATTLIDLKGLQDDTLYHTRIRKLLKDMPPPAPFTQERWLKLIDKHAYAQELSALLPTLSLSTSTGRLVVPLTDRYFDVNSSPDRVQTHGRAISNISVRARRPFAETANEQSEADRAHNEHHRAWYHFGASPPTAAVGGDKSSSVLSPDRILISRSYTSHDWDSPQAQPHQYEALLLPLSLRAEDAVSQGLSWLRASPLPPSTIGEYLWENAYSDEAALNSTIKPTTMERMRSYKARNKLPPALAEVVDDDEAILKHLDRHAPNKWKLYAAAMGVHPHSIRKWLTRKEAIKPSQVVPKGKQALTNKLISSTSLKTYFHPLALTRFVFMLEHTILANRAVKFFFQLAASTLGLQEDLPWPTHDVGGKNISEVSLNASLVRDVNVMNVNKVRNLGTQSCFDFSAPRTITTSSPTPDKLVRRRHPCPPVFGAVYVQSRSAEEQGDSALVDHLTREYEDILTPIKHVIEYSRWTGSCWFWDASKIGSLDGRNVDRHSSSGLPSTMVGAFFGFWRPDERSGTRHAYLLSETGEIHLDSSVILSALWLSLEDSFSKPVHHTSIRRLNTTSVHPDTVLKGEDQASRWPQDSFYELEVKGFVLNPHLTEQQVDPAIAAWRTGASGSGVRCEWTVVVSPRDWLGQDLVPGTVFDVMEIGHVTQGHVHKRVDFIQLSLVDRGQREQATSGAGPVNRLSEKLVRRRTRTQWVQTFTPRARPSLVVKLHGMDMMMKNRIFAVDETALSEILYAQGLDSTDPVQRQELLLRSSQYTDSYPTYADAFPTLTVSTSAVPFLRKDASSLLPHFTEERMEPLRLRLAIKERLNHFLVTSPKRHLHDRLAALANPLELGSPLTRGFGIPKAAQLADDASLMARFNLAAAEGAFRPVLLGDGVVAGFSRQLVAERFTVTGVHLGVEAPYESLQALHRQAAMLSTRVSDSAAVRFSSKVAPNANDTSGDSIFLKILTEKLVADPALEKIARKFAAARPSGGKTAALASGPMNAALQQFEEVDGPLTPDDPQARADMFVDSLVAGVGAAQRPVEFGSADESNSRVILSESLTEAVAAAVRELRQVAGEGALEEAADQFRDLTIIALVENEETGELVTQKTDINLRDFAAPLKAPEIAEPSLATSPPPGLEPVTGEGLSQAPSRSQVETVTSTTSPKLTQTATQYASSPTSEEEQETSQSDHMVEPKEMLQERLQDYLERTLLDMVDSITVEEVMLGLDTSLDMAALEGAMGETEDEALDNLLRALSEDDEAPMTYETDGDVDLLQARLGEKVASIWSGLIERPEIMDRIGRVLEQEDLLAGELDAAEQDDDEVMRIAVEMPDETGEGFIVEEFDIPRDVLEDEAKLTTYFEDLGYEMGSTNGEPYNSLDSDELLNESANAQEAGGVLESLRLDLGTGVLEGVAF